MNLIVALLFILMVATCITKLIKAIFRVKDYSAGYKKVYMGSYLVLWFWIFIFWPVALALYITNSKWVGAK